MTTLLPREEFRGYEHYADNAEAVAKFAFGGDHARTRMHAEALKADVFVLLDRGGGYDSLAKWETGLILAVALMKEINTQMEAVSLQYPGDAYHNKQHLDTLERVRLELELTVQSQVSFSREFMAGQAGAIQQMFRQLEDTYGRDIKNFSREASQAHERKTRQLERQFDELADHSTAFQMAADVGRLTKDQAVTAGPGEDTPEGREAPKAAVKGGQPKPPQT